MSMTLERAAEILNVTIVDPYEKNIHLLNEACFIGRQAILKQISKRPDYEADGYDENGNLIYDAAYCPICRHEFEYGINDWGSKFCSDCGQALDWSEGDE